MANQPAWDSPGKNLVFSGRPRMEHASGKHHVKSSRTGKHLVFGSRGRLGAGREMTAENLVNTW